jgi:hypothetical protein
MGNLDQLLRYSLLHWEPTQSVSVLFIAALGACSSSVLFIVALGAYPSSVLNSLLHWEPLTHLDTLKFFDRKPAWSAPLEWPAMITSDHRTAFWVESRYVDQGAPRYAKALAARLTIESG